MEIFILFVFLILAIAVILFLAAIERKIALIVQKLNFPMQGEKNIADCFKISESEKKQFENFFNYDGTANGQKSIDQD